MEDCVFCKIVRGEIPAEFTYQDEEIAVFKDNKPVKPIHLLIIPKIHVKEFVDLETRLLGRINKIIMKLVNEMNLTEKGYKVVVNGGAAMSVPHLHFHLLAPIRATDTI